MLSKKLNKGRATKAPLWNRTDDIYGHKPEFEIKCRHCGQDMPVRHSTIAVQKTRGDEDVALNQICYKCKYCAWFITFTVEDSPRYLKRVVKKYRKGNNKLVPVEDWTSDDEKIAKQLESLGYFGGREEMI